LLERNLGFSFWLPYESEEGHLGFGRRKNNGVGEAFDSDQCRRRQPCMKVEFVARMEQLSGGGLHE